jgi:transcriptional regulator with XRE-family HTH domain
LTPQEAVGRRIYEIRTGLGMTQEQVGERLEHYLGRPWPKQAISQAERGLREFDVTELLAFSMVLVTSVADLVRAPFDEEIEFPGGYSMNGYQLFGRVLGMSGAVPGSKEASHIQAFATALDTVIRESVEPVHRDIGKAIDNLREVWNQARGDARGWTRPDELEVDLTKDMEEQFSDREGDL